MRRVDMETIILCAVIAVVATIGMLTFAAALMGVRFQDWDAVWLTGSGCTLVGVLWGVLLIFNSNMLTHTA